MTEVHEIVAVVYLVLGVGILALLWKSVRHRNTPGAEGFTVLVIAVSIWAITEALSLLYPSIRPLALWYVLIVAAASVAVGYLLLAASFTSRQSPSNRLRVALWAYPVALVLGIVVGDLTIQSGDVVLETVMWSSTGRILDKGYGVGFWLHTALAYLFTLSGIGLLVIEYIRTHGLRRVQSAILAATSLPPFVLSIVNVSDLATWQFDPTPLGYLFSAVILSWGLFRIDLLDITPVARETAMAEMDDAVITLNTDDQVVDCNPAARRLFDVDETEYYGSSAAEFFSPIPRETLEQFETVMDVDTEIAVSIGGGQRYFSLSISPIERDGHTNGRVIVLRDITPIKRRETELESREKELDLVRQLFSRVLRHNLRNELTVIRGHAEGISTGAADPYDEQARQIVDASETLLTISQKARQIERIVNTDVENAEVDLRNVVESASETIQERFPAATIEIEGPESRHVHCGPGIEIAIENLLENAVEHTESDCPVVSVEISDHDRPPRVTVSDDGPGIETDELVVLEEASESQLLHGSGVGLWLVKWVVDRSDAELTFETGPEGTEVTILFEEAL